jgi:cell division protein FtsB
VAIRERVDALRKRRKKRGKGGTRLVDLSILGMLLLATYFAIFGGEFSIFELRRLEALNVRASAELAEVEAEIDSLSSLASELRDDPEAIERVARERYGMIRDGEILYRFQEASEPEAKIDEDKSRK